MRTLEALLKEGIELLEKSGVDAQVLKLNSIAPLDMDTLTECVRQTGRLLVAEECVDTGCVGRMIASELMLSGIGNIKIALVNLGDRFVTQGSVSQLRALCGIDGLSLSKKAMEMMT